MKITLYSNWWIKPGYEKKAIPILKKLAAKVKKNEPGTLRYLVHYPKGRFPSKYDFKSEPETRPGAVTFVETYTSWDAFNAHVNGRIFKGFVKKYGRMFVQSNPKKVRIKGTKKWKMVKGPFVQVVFMEQVAGFDRL